MRTDIVCCWFLMLVYTFPTVFLAMVVVAEVRPYEHGLWIMWIFGGLATWLAITIRYQNLKGTQ